MLYRMSNPIADGYMNFLGQLRVSVNLSGTENQNGRGPSLVLDRAQAQSLFGQLTVALALPGCSDDEPTTVDVDVRGLINAKSVR
jgi:hypothetical protein